MVAIPVVLSLSLSLGVVLYAERAQRHRAAVLKREIDHLNRLLLATLDYVQRVRLVEATDGTTP
jgi:hypothetical protein